MRRTIAPTDTVYGTMTFDEVLTAARAAVAMAAAWPDRKNMADLDQVLTYHQVTCLNLMRRAMVDTGGGV